MAFMFEKLEVYRKSLEWVHTVDDLIKLARDGLSYPFADQLTRAALSIPLNIAEGNGRWHKGEKQQYFRIARGSIFECVAILQLLHQKQSISDQLYKEAYLQLETLSKMLHGLIRTIADRNAS